MLSVTRLDSHQHQPVYKTGAFLSRATSALKHEREESNPVRQFWRLAALPGAQNKLLNSGLTVARPVRFDRLR